VDGKNWIQKERWNADGWTADGKILQDSPRNRQ